MGEGVGGVEIMDAAVHVFVGALGFFDFKAIEGFGMDDAFDVFPRVNNGEIGEAGFVEFIEDEGAEDFGVFHEDDARARSHEIGNLAVIKTHDGGKASAIRGI